MHRRWAWIMALLYGLAIGFAGGAATILHLSQPVAPKGPSKYTVIVGVTDESGKVWMWYRAPSDQDIPVLGRVVHLKVEPAPEP